MDHHVLHVAREHRVPVLVDLTSAPGRTVVFTRTKHGAKALARQLNKRGVPAVELHGNLSQGARTRNMEAFHAGRATTLVATDIAARGIHVDDVALVVHADPPAEHKAYLHRSGRTARAGAAGTVITLMTDEQVRDVRDLTRAAGIKPTITRVDGPRHPMLDHARPRRAQPGARWPDDRRLPRLRKRFGLAVPAQVRRSTPPGTQERSGPEPAIRTLPGRPRRRRPAGRQGRLLRRQLRRGQPQPAPSQPRCRRRKRHRQAQRGLLQRPSGLSPTGGEGCEPPHEDD